MTNGEATKVCPMCAETIKAAAKVCPFCQTRLTRYALLRQELSVGVPAVLLLGLALAVCAWLIPSEPGAPGRGRRFPPHRGDLVVHQVALESAKKRPEFWLSGFVSNRGTYPWRVERLEVRFLEGENRLLDVQHPGITEAFVVQPARECAFRVSLGRLPLAVTQATVTSRVQEASDGNLPRDRD
jgi:hypothetical protein